MKSEFLNDRNALYTQVLQVAGPDDKFKALFNFHYVNLMVQLTGRLCSMLTLKLLTVSVSVLQDRIRSRNRGAYCEYTLASTTCQ